MLVNLAHVGESRFDSALEVTTRPVTFSHGNARALCDHPRNLSDAQLRALARNGDIIGLSVEASSREADVRAVLGINTLRVLQATIG